VSQPTYPPVDAAEESATVARRSLLAWTGGLIGAGTLGIPTGTASAFAQAKDGPVSMAMHIHGSFSEGMASMDAHLFQARRLGVDVIWWTDHDFRAAAFGYRSKVGLASAHEPEGPWDWSWSPSTSGDPQQCSHTFVKTPHSPDETGGALLIQAQASGATTWLDYQLKAVSANLLYSTSYFDTTVSVDVLPEQVGRDAQVVIEVISSYRPASHGRRAGQYRIQYRVGGATPGYSHEDGGLLGVVTIAAGAADQWQRVEMDLHTAHQALWPDTVAGDASLVELRIGVRARRAAKVRAVLDRLRFARTRRGSADALAALRRAIRDYQGRYPHVTQIAASEVSLVNHLNAFGGDHVVPPYTMRYPVKDTRNSAQRAAVAFLHDHGAVVSINHPLQDPRNASALARRLVTTNGNGADVIEIGTRARTSALELVYDIAARNAVFLTANGVTDDHSGDNWLTQVSPYVRWLTSVWSPTRRKADLCHALLAGRAWFYDPLHWRGTFDLLVGGRTPMGGVHFTAKRLVGLEVSATDLPHHSTLEVVVGRCDRAGARHLTAVNTRTAVASTRVKGGTWSTGVSVRNGVYVRAMVRSHSGAIMGFSNPVWVLPAAQAATFHVPKARLHG
jgi:hypothetical protein